MKYPFITFCGLCLGVSAGGVAYAKKSYPYFTGEAVFELQTEEGYDSDDKDNERNNTFWRTEVSPKLSFNRHVFMDGLLVMEPVQESDPGDNNFLDNEGVYIQELKLNYNKGPYAFFVGKFNPGFGIAWDYGRGIWSEEFAEDYQIIEKLGVGGSYTLKTEKAGEHKLTASTFFTDTTGLSESVITGRGNVDKDDGGAANTEDFSSFVISLEGDGVAGVKNLYYQLAFRHLAQGDADAEGDDEQGVAATLGYVFPVVDNVEMDALLEYANIHHFDAGMEDREYLSGSLVTRFFENWNVTVGYTKRNVEPEGEVDINDHLLQATGGYDFGNGLTLDAGWLGTEESDVDTNIIGALARYTVGF